MNTPKKSVNCEECGGLTNFSPYLCSVCWQEYYPYKTPEGVTLEEDVLWPPYLRNVKGEANRNTNRYNKAPQ